MAVGYTFASVSINVLGKHFESIWGRFLIRHGYEKVRVKLRLGSVKSLNGSKGRI